MIEVILDSSYLVALLDEKDHWHQQAVSIHQVLETLDVQAHYFDCVINETLSVIGKRLEQRRQSEAFSDILTKVQQQVHMELITWVYLEVKRWYPTLLALMQTHQGRLNFHDALIVTAAKEMGVSRIVSFDADFDEIKELQRIKAASDLQPEEAPKPDENLNDQ